ncbi:zinc-activated ligand-gated ion channel-like isoform X2 [Ostrinia furnacalis]|uniref:zinc-activated ligand-gated ion channel-like isoform X2 n=1 Tax=Ostrinia furnacalis TaxID=93504 RepID=UPI0010393C84|nr:zinc-activated ligand-gated ion channel-like isoform X2 [Ostrinia furnacalis]
MWLARSARALLLPALLLVLAGPAEACTNVTSLSQQLDALLAEYDREAAPALPVRVRLSFEPRHAALTADASVHMLADLVMTWSDPRIEWNASDWGCDSLVAATDRLWVPDLELLNGASGAQTAQGARIGSDGLLALVLRLDAVVPVRVQLAGWPADRQRALFKFGSRTLNTDELILEIDEFTTAVVFETGSWELMSVTGQLAPEAERSVAAWSVTLRRRAAAHEAASGAVLAAAALMLLSAALLPPLARAPLCACASFTAAVWLVSALLRLPASSSTPTAVVVFCVVCVAGGAGGACAALVARVARASSAPPRSLRTLASAFSVLCRLSPGEDTCQAAEVGAWAALALLLDRALLAALLLAVFVAVCVYL